MTGVFRQSLVEEMIALLIRRFGIDAVQAAVAKASSRTVTAAEGQPRNRPSGHKVKSGPTIASVLEHLRQNDEDKYHLLDGFYTRVKNRTVLPESQDIQFFAQIIGLKEISGKSRKLMIPKLMRFLLEQPTDRLRDEIATAATVSEQQRKKGFSVLTDSLLGVKPVKPE